MSPIRQVAACAALGWCLAGPAAAGAQDDRLAAAGSLDCSFTLIATGTWTDGDPEADVDAATCPSASRPSTRRAPPPR